MKIIQTFWSGPAGAYGPADISRPADASKLTDTSGPAGISGPAASSPPLGLRGGWLSPEYHWMSWALSCLQLKALYGEVELITDRRGKEILIDLLGLPYTSVNTSLEGVLDHYPPQVWALAKIHSYSIQDQPFIHVDGDVFLWQPFSEDILQADLVSQNPELNLSFYRTMLDEINTHFAYIPPLFSRQHYADRDIHSSNAGLLGGRDLAFIARYCRMAFEFVDKNLASLSKVNTANLNFVFEQYLLRQLAGQEQRPITYFMEDVVQDPIFRDYVRFEDYPFVKMVHPVGGFKKMQNICNQLAKKLRKDHPGYYYRIVDELKKQKIALNARYYYKHKHDRPPGWERTVHALAWLYPGIQSPPDNDTIRATITALPEDDRKEFVQEIHAVESAKTQCYEQWIDNPGHLDRLYEDDRRQFQLIQGSFGTDFSRSQTTRLRLNGTVCIMDIHWGWRYEHPEQIKGMIETNFATPKVDGQMALIPVALQMTVNEYNLDQLDMIIVELCREEKELKEIITAVKPFFPPEEVGANEAAFLRLMTDSVKRLAYAGILSVVE
jgi:hypothetical protein